MILSGQELTIKEFLVLGNFQYYFEEQCGRGEKKRQVVVQCSTEGRWAGRPPMPKGPVKKRKCWKEGKDRAAGLEPRAFCPHVNRQPQASQGQGETTASPSSSIVHYYRFSLLFRFQAGFCPDFRTKIRLLGQRLLSRMAESGQNIFDVKIFLHPVRFDFKISCLAHGFLANSPKQYI